MIQDIIDNCKGMNIEEASAQILYDCTGMDSANHSGIVEAMFTLVVFAQRWIPVEEEEIPLNEYVNLKDDEGCILAFKFDSEVERIQLLRANPATHWRPINLK